MRRVVILPERVRGRSRRPFWCWWSTVRASQQSTGQGPPCQQGVPWQEQWPPRKERTARRARASAWVDFRRLLAAQGVQRRGLGRAEGRWHSEQRGRG